MEEALGSQAFRKSSQRGSQVYIYMPLQLRRVQSRPDAKHCPSGLWVLPMFCGVASGASPQRPRFLSLAQMASAGREPSPAGLLLGIS